MTKLIVIVFLFVSCALWAQSAEQRSGCLALGDGTLFCGDGEIAWASATQGDASGTIKAKPKREAIKFAAAAVAFSSSSAFQIFAQHQGARECQAEDNRGGAGKLFGTADGYGRRPPDAREYAISGSILGGSLVLELTGHKKIAKRILWIGSAVKYGVASATYWYGCN